MEKDSTPTVKFTTRLSYKDNAKLEKIANDMGKCSKNEAIKRLINKEYER